MLKIQDLRKVYKKTVALQAISFRLAFFYKDK